MTTLDSTRQALVALAGSVPKLVKASDVLAAKGGDADEEADHMAKGLVDVSRKIGVVVDKQYMLENAHARLHQDNRRAIAERDDAVALAARHERDLLAATETLAARQAWLGGVAAACCIVAAVGWLRPQVFVAVPQAVQSPRQSMTPGQAAPTSDDDAYRSVFDGSYQPEPRAKRR